jgi:GDP-L-fucose synthase
LNQCKEVTIWGTGNAKREFLYVDDAADTLLFLMENYDRPEHINIGSGEDISILNLAHLISEIIGFKGQIKTDPGKPDGMPRKLMDNSRLKALGWEHKLGLKEGLQKTYEYFLAR